MDSKKVCGLKNTVVKKDMKSKLATKNGYDGRLKAKSLITTIQMNLALIAGLFWIRFYFFL